MLDVLLIEDKNTDYAAASMNVGVGHYSDPEHFLGLAHFCEHMLFLGSENFPDESEFSMYLASHSGSSNAYTDAGNTNYYFTVDKNYLYGALERWSQFFVAPLFEADATSRELNAVFSENAKNLQNDLWREDQLMRGLSNPNHPHSKFGTGNNESLVQIPAQFGEDLRTTLINFYSTYYSSNIMKLVILGKDPIEQLEEWAMQLFNSVPNRNVPLPQWTEKPFLPQYLMKKIYLVPLVNANGLEMRFSLPSMEEFFWYKPIDYISYFLGHEAEGTVFWTLKTNGWATELEAGLAEDRSQFSEFIVGVHLTPLGIGNR